ncbi:pannexin-1 [Anomaloglossus baeobatrachus]
MTSLLMVSQLTPSIASNVDYNTEAVKGHLHNEWGLHFSEVKRVLSTLLEIETEMESLLSTIKSKLSEDALQRFNEEMDLESKNVKERWLSINLKNSKEIWLIKLTIESTALKDLYLFSRKLILKKLHNKKSGGLDTMSDLEQEALAALEDLLAEQTNNPVCPAVEIFTKLVMEDFKKISTRRFSDNLTMKQRQALTELQQLDDVVFKAADKGGNIVIWPIVQYEREVFKQLRHKDTYQKPLVESLPSYAKDTTDVLMRVDGISMESDLLFVTMDVESLYTCIRHEDGVRAARFFLEMSGRDSDLNELGTVEQLDSFVQCLNSNIFNIRLTYKFSSTSIDFLDIVLEVDGNQRVQTDVFRKKTSVNALLHASSGHMGSTVRAIPTGQILRMRRICSSDASFELLAFLLLALALKLSKPVIPRGVYSQKGRGLTLFSVILCVTSGGSSYTPNCLGLPIRARRKGIYGAQISCFAPSSFSWRQAAYVDSFCWAAVQQKDLSYSDSGSVPLRLHKFFPYILLLGAVLLYLPSLFWRFTAAPHLCSDLKFIMEELDKSYNRAIKASSKKEAASPPSAPPSVSQSLLEISEGYFKYPFVEQYLKTKKMSYNLITKYLICRSWTLVIMLLACVYLGCYISVFSLTDEFSCNIRTGILKNDTTLPPLIQCKLIAVGVFQLLSYINLIVYCLVMPVVIYTMLVPCRRRSDVLKVYESVVPNFSVHQCYSKSYDDLSIFLLFLEENVSELKSYKFLRVLENLKETGEDFDTMQLLRTLGTVKMDTVDGKQTAFKSAALPPTGQNSTELKDLTTNDGVKTSTDDKKVRQRLLDSSC